MQISQTMIRLEVQMKLMVLRSLQQNQIQSLSRSRIGAPCLMQTLHNKVLPTL